MLMSSSSSAVTEASVARVTLVTHHARSGAMHAPCTHACTMHPCMHHAPMHAPCTHACTPRLTLSLALGDGVLSRVLPCSRERMTPDIITAMRAHCACSLTIAMHCNVGEQGCARAVGLEVVLSH